MHFLSALFKAESKGGPHPSTFQMDTIFLRLILPGFKFLKVELNWHFQMHATCMCCYILHKLLVIKEKKNQKKQGKHVKLYINIYGFFQVNSRMGKGVKNV